MGDLGLQFQSQAALSWMEDVEKVLKKKSACAYE
jgi:hypothetical protein